MRELAKSVVSFSWALPLYGLRQAVNLVDLREWTGSGKTVNALAAVTTAARQQLEGVLAQTFEVGDRLQRTTIDVFFDLVGGGRPAPAGPGNPPMPAPAPRPQPMPAAPAARPAERTPGWGPVPPGTY